MTRKAAVLMILLGGTFMSFVGLLLRLIDQADGFQILTYRSIALCIAVATVSCIWHKTSLSEFIRKLDVHDVKMGASLSIAFTTYIFSMLFTSVASTLFIITVAPFMAAIIAWFWLGERPHPFTWIAMIGAITGVSLMIGDGMEYDRTFGNILALISAFTFALMLVLARRSKKSDVLGGTFLGGLFTTIIAASAALLVGSGLSVGFNDLGLSLFMGAFTIGIGIAFVTMGTPYVPAAEVSLLVLIESVLGPIWVWVFLSEAMSQLEIIGGSIVLLSVVTLAQLSGRSAAAKA